MDGKIKKLREICEKAANDIFGKDEDGDPIIDIKIIDRRKYWPMHFFAIPYDHKAQTTKDLLEILNYSMANLRMAQDRVDTWWRLYGEHIKFKTMPPV